MALGSSESPSIAAEITTASAREMKMVGINWAFSPVADINSDPRNPVIGVRSFGEDPNVVATFASTVASALASEGIAPCAKHFPGHGDTHVDSHLSLPVIHKSLDELRATELVPFNTLTSLPTPIASIMTAHIALPLLHPPPAQNAIPAPSAPSPPASLSRLISTTLLRSAPPAGLGYSGVCVTDCLEMNAISEGVGVGPGAVAAIRAGADVVMICHRLDRQMAALQSVYEAVRRGFVTDTDENESSVFISLDELKASGERIRALKDRFVGSWGDVLDRTLDLAEFESLQTQNAHLSQRAYRQTTRWLSPTMSTSQGRLSQDDRILILTPAMESINPAVDEPEPTEKTPAEGEDGILKTADGRLRNTAGPSYISFAHAIQARFPRSSHLVYTASDSSSVTLCETLADAIVSAQSIIFTTRNAHQASSAWQLYVLRRLLKEIRESGGDVKVIVLASCAPYDYASLQESAETKDLPMLCTYEFTKEALEAAANILCGVD